jgi:hypothetical protein
LVGLMCAQKGKYFHEALGLEGESGLYWKGLPTEPHMKKKSVCLGISHLKNILQVCVVQIHLETTK